MKLYDSPNGRPWEGIVMPGESGEDWFAEGHLSPLSMLWGAIQAELELTSEADLMEHDFRFWRSVHCYVKQHPEYEDSMIRAEAGDPDAEPWTWASV